MKQRTIVIGDIHGARKALEEVLQKVGLRRDDRLIFLGDYVDGWSESAGVIQYLMELEQRYECIFIKGNHDAWCEDWLEGKGAEETWLYHGGQATVDSYAGMDAAAQVMHRHFFNRLRHYFVDEDNKLYIHAGFASTQGPEHERYDSTSSWDRSLWRMALAMNRYARKSAAPLPEQLGLYKEIFIGHTPTLYYDMDVPMQGCNVWNADTGAAFTGKLTALDAATKAYWQSTRVPALYPHEKGRNK